MKRNLHAGRPRSGGLSLSVFTDAEMDDIHLGSLEVLERTGMWVEADDALDIFGDGGCVVDRETRMVRIPPHLVEDALRSCPPKSFLCGRDPEQDIVLEAGRVYVSNFDEGIMIVDPRTGEYRHPVLQDVREAARLVDALSDIDTYESAVHPADVPEETASLHKWEAAIQNTGKPVGTEATSAYDVRKLIEMATVIVGRRRRVPPPPADRLRRLPGEPAQAAARRHRGDHRVGARLVPRHDPQHGDVRRLVAGHAGRHARAAQRRGARAASCWRSSPSAAAPSPTALDHGHGPQAGGGVAWARPSSPSSAPPAPRSRAAT